MIPIEQNEFPQESGPVNPVIGSIINLDGIDSRITDPQQFQDNLDQLKSKGELGEMFSVLYTAAVKAEPRLSEVLVRATGSDVDPVLKETGGHATHAGKSDSGRYEITVNTDDGLAHYERLFEIRHKSVLASVAKIGFNPEGFDAKALAGFIFLHELGHIVDFMHNAPDFDSHTERRNADMATLPVPKFNPVTLLKFLDTEDGKNWFAKAKSALENKFGVTTPSELVDYQDVQYRALPTEDIPDKFAAEVIRPFL